MKYKPKDDATLTLQFWQDYIGNLNFLVTTNDGDIADSSFLKTDYPRFGAQLAQIETLNREEKYCLSLFCKGYLEEFNKSNHPEKGKGGAE